jgi:hypothetical protein
VENRSVGHVTFLVYTISCIWTDTFLLRLALFLSEEKLVLQGQSLDTPCILGRPRPILKHIYLDLTPIFEFLPSKESSPKA